MAKRAYKIRDLRTGKHISIGYRSKSTWNSFPSQVILNNTHVIPKGSKDFVVDVFELIQIDTVSLEGLKINQS